MKKESVSEERLSALKRGGGTKHARCLNELREGTNQRMTRNSTRYNSQTSMLCMYSMAIVMDYSGGWPLWIAFYT
jgi:hypothetical protein